MIDKNEQFIEQLTDVSFDGLKMMKAMLQYLGKDGPEFQRLKAKAAIGAMAVGAKVRMESAMNQRALIQLHLNSGGKTPLKQIETK